MKDNFPSLIPDIYYINSNYKNNKVLIEHDIVYPCIRKPSLSDAGVG
jgi:hypothetical protein